MDLETLLPAIRSLPNLPGLVAALGHQPLWEILPQERRDHGQPVMVVGHSGELPWLAVSAAKTETTAQRLASRLSKRGRVCLVLALDEEARRLAVAVGFDDCPSLELDLRRPSPEALASLGKLAASSEDAGLAFAARAAEALRAEPVGRRFFREFRTTLTVMSAGLPHSIQLEDRHSLALLQLTRVLFLYFIQTKGWLDGRLRFLSEEVDGCLRRRRRIHRDLLRPLFFGTLNRSADHRSRSAVDFGSIPFLNGGLFEPHALERRFPANIPNDIWRNAFDQLFERFHFTVGEGERHGGVAPDMLGRVFEGVMTPAARHASGTFYTPSVLVGEVLDAAMTALLSIRLKCGNAEAERKLRDPDSGVARLFANVTLLDPAVGSGAFLLGALDRLARLTSEGPLSSSKRRVLERNLFGVDLSGTAVRLTELRLWLAVIADDPAESAHDVRPLPNLDCLVRQGDSLFDPMHQEPETSRVDAAIVAEMSALRHALIVASGSDKRGLIRNLRSLETRVLTDSLIIAEQRNRSELLEYLQGAKAHDLFGKNRGLDRRLTAHLRDLRVKGHALRQTRKRLARDGNVPWFHYQSHFADVFASGGFDLVVGNPPWVRSEGLPSLVRRRLAGRYRWWRSTGRAFGNSPDLSVAFMERSLELAARGGVLAMLVPVKITSAGYASIARHALATTTTIHALADLTRDSSADFGATVYPMALIASKSPPTAGHRVRTTLLVKEGSVAQSELLGGAPWILVKDELRDVLSALNADHPTVADSFQCQLGVKTGANRVFLNPPQTIDSELLRWAVRGRDVRAFGCTPRATLLWTHDERGRVRDELPPSCMAYFASHEEELRRRKDYTRGPLWTLFRVHAAVSKNRVVWPDLSRTLVAAALTTAADLRCIALNSCYVAAAPDAPVAERLAACLNSTWLRAVAMLNAVPAASGFSRFSARTVGALPLPASILADPSLSTLAEEAREGATVQAGLDQLVAQHLGLSKTGQNALRAVVDSASRHSG
jgi:hypothetical protein